jgi:hypothetical protein
MPKGGQQIVRGRAEPERLGGSVRGKPNKRSLANESADITATRGAPALVTLRVITRPLDGLTVLPSFVPRSFYPSPWILTVLHVYITSLPNPTADARSTQPSTALPQLLILSYLPACLPHRPRPPHPHHRKTPCPPTSRADITLHV